MSLESALQRVQHLESLTGQSVQAPDRRGTDAQGTQFSAMLQARMLQGQISSEAADTGDELGLNPATLLGANGMPGGLTAPGMPGGLTVPGMPGGYGGTGAAGGIDIPGMPGGYGQPGMASAFGGPGVMNAGMPASIAASYGLPVTSQAWGYGAMSAIGGLQPTAPGMVGLRMVQLAQGELGVRESPPGSNESPRIRQYRTATAGAENIPGPWCAYFVSWLAREAGAPIGANGNGTGYVPTLTNWGKQVGRFVGAENRPSPGDIVIFDRGGIPGHTGIVENIAADGRVHTIEGNSSNRVARRSYAGTSAEIIGYIRMG
jgi:uncharacterized protein (TIGR02594 family)